MVDINSTEVRDAFHIGMTQGQPRRVSNHSSPYVVIPKDAQVHDVERTLLRPVRHRGIVTLHDQQSFVSYVNTFRTDGSAIFADQTSSAVVCVLNYHNETQPDWCDWRAVYSMPRSLEWSKWLQANSRKMAQADFARFIEENQVDIRTPAGATILEVASHLEAKKKVDFVSATRLQDGTRQFVYRETVEGTTTKGGITIPEEFTIGIPVFQGGEPWAMKAFLRYRIDEGKLMLWFDLFRPEQVLQAAFAETVTQIAEGTNIRPYMGVSQ